MQIASLERQRWTTALLALAALALVFLLHPYRGIVHDGHLYTLQALNQLHPELYSNDVFLRYGSQDNYTLFSPIYAAAISMLELEPAAATITFLSILLFLAAASTLARIVIPESCSWAALLLLLLVPAHYGPGQIFHFIEEFVTPRQLAEALTIFAIASRLHGWRIASVLLCIASMLIHPVMGLAGAVFLAAFEIGLARLKTLWPIAVLTVALIVIAAAGLIPLERWQFDPQWREIAMSRVYLSMTHWNIEDWGRVATVFGSLSVTALTLERLPRQVASLAMLTCGSLLLLSLVCGDLLGLVLIVQAQPWRSLWLATVVALILLPATCTANWHRGAIHRCAVLLLAAAWASPDATFSLGLAPLSVLAAMSVDRRPVEVHSRLLIPGAWLILVMVLVYAVCDGLLAFRGGLTRMQELQPFLDKVSTASLNGALPALSIAMSYLIIRRLQPAALAAMSLALATFVALLALTAGSTWVMDRHPTQQRKAFSAWRAAIPPGSDVLWIGQTTDREDTAFYTWVLLERPSFISRNQASNALFSRAAAIEMYRRARMLDGILPFWDPFRSDTPPVLRPLRLAPVCENTPVRYVVSSEPMEDAAGIALTAAAGHEFNQYRLYTCS